MTRSAEGPFVREGSRAVRATSLAEIELAASRRALSLLKSRISPDRMEALLRAEVEAADAYLRGMVAQSEGAYRSSLVEFGARGLRAGDFMAWLGGTIDADGGLLDWHPEHYQHATQEDAAVQQMIEPLGDRIVRLLVEFADPSVSPVPPDPDFEFHLAAVQRLKDGTEVARVLHQYRDDGPDGMVGRIELFCPRACPDELIEQQQLHLLVEAGHWVASAQRAVSPAPSGAGA